MNREIEFRAWLKNQKVMRNNVSIHAGTIFTGYAWIPLDGIELMQYTGQTDKYGVKIFESDIVKRTYNDGQYVELAVVEYDDYYCQFIFQGFNYDLDINFNRLEVIGNIFENPELLEVK